MEGNQQYGSLADDMWTARTKHFNSTRKSVQYASPEMGVNATRPRTLNTNSSRVSRGMDKCWALKGLDPYEGEEAEACHCLGGVDEVACKGQDIA